MGYPNLSPGTPEQIFDEIRKCTPSYAGITYKRLEKGGIQWPCPNEEHPGTAILHKEKFVRGLALFSVCEHLEPAELPDKEYPFILSTGRILYQFHTSSMSGNSQVLTEKAPENYIEIHPKDAARLKIKAGEFVRVRSRRGEVTVKALISNRPFKGGVFLPWHYASSAANILTIDALDPIAKIPEYKVAAVAIEKV
jgi:predicted molibdopterin-dependent oxidoreductase YjgC